MIKDVVQSSSNSLNLPTQEIKEQIDLLIGNCKQLLTKASTTCSSDGCSLDKMNALLEFGDCSIRVYRSLQIPIYF